VRGKADGVQFSKRLERAGLAQVWKEQLDRGFANGLPFDLRSRRFVTSETPAEARPELPATVFAITEAFYWANPDWEPKTKILAAAAFNRARRWLLDPRSVLAGDDLEAAGGFTSCTPASTAAPHQVTTSSTVPWSATRRRR
jgi:hypothetical protein